MIKDLCGILVIVRVNCDIGDMKVENAEKK